LALDAVEWSGTYPGCFTLDESATGIYGIGGCMSPVAGLGMLEKRRILPLDNPLVLKCFVISLF
jgi:hypothetical protein